MVSSSSSSSKLSWKRKVCLGIIPLIFSLWLIKTDNNSNNNSSGNSSKYVLIIGLQQSLPSLRIYRFLLEFNLILFCLSFMLYVWSKYVSDDIIGNLLFQPNPNLDSLLSLNYNNSGSKRKRRNKGHYQPVSIDEDDDNDDDGDDDDDDDNINEKDKDDCNDDDDDNENDSDNEKDDERDFTNTGDDNNSNNEKDDTFKENEEKETSLSGSFCIFKPPLPSYVLNMSLDLLLLILINIFFFTLFSSFTINNEQEEEQKQTTTTTTATTSVLVQQHVGIITRRYNIAPLCPLILFFYLIYKSIYPWNSGYRKDMWYVLMRTIGAPYYTVPTVTFRDGFIGDVLTSTVRPLQDLAYTIFYLLNGFNEFFILNNVVSTSQQQGIGGSSTAAIGASSAAVASATNVVINKLGIPTIEYSWILHTIILPACIISPLWYRYLQTLKQVYDNKKRWPYMGNSFKYCFAAVVAMFGIFHPSLRTTSIWKFFFILTTLYQIYWDIFMDWELFTVTFQPKFTIKLRSNQIYTTNKYLYYYGILVINIILRFGWTLSFLPNEYLHPKSGLLQDVLKQNDISIEKFIEPFLACIEIIRRTLWGLLRLELEVIKTTADNSIAKQDDVRQHNKNQEEENNHEVSIIHNNNEMDDTENSSNNNNCTATKHNNTNKDNGDDHDQKEDVEALLELVDMKPMSIDNNNNGNTTFINISSVGSTTLLPFTTLSLSSSSPLGGVPALLSLDLKNASNIQIIIELTLWVITFCGLGLLAAAHRQTM